MTIEEHERLMAAKREAEWHASNAKSYGELRGSGGMALAQDEPMRASLRERVAMDLQLAQRQARKWEHLKELSDLLDKHPDMARILDLVEMVRG